MLQRHQPNVMLFVRNFSSPRFVRQFFGVVSLFLITSSAFAQSTFLPVTSTPYDRQMSRIHPILNCKASPAATAAAIPLPITVWMIELRAVPYHYSRHWQTPAELRLAQESDCKGKSLALFEEMRKGGARNLRIVIGKRHIFDASTHTWVQWDTNDGSYILDPTFNDSPTRAALLDPSTYVPFYAFDGEHKYRAMNPALMANTPAIVKPQMQSAPTPAMGSYRPTTTRTASARTATAATTMRVVATASANRINYPPVQQPARSTSTIAPKSYATTVTTAPAVTKNSSSASYSKAVNAPISMAAAATPAPPKPAVHKTSNAKQHSSSHATHHRRHHHRPPAVGASG